MHIRDPRRQPSRLRLVLVGVGILLFCGYAIVAKTPPRTPTVVAPPTQAQLALLPELKARFEAEKDDRKKLGLAMQIRAIDRSDFQMELRQNEIQYRLDLPNKMAATPHTFLNLSNVEWEKGGFGAVFIASFTVKNPLPFDVKDVGMQCDVFGESGTKIGTVSETAYKTIKANKSLRVQKLSMGFIRSQSHTADCRIVSAKKV